LLSTSKAASTIAAWSNLALAPIAFPGILDNLTTLNQAAI
jgi:Na+-transporting methylmalonyl-CoA/oxaloacetate decarboxylase beta subunit